MKRVLLSALLSMSACFVASAQDYNDGKGSIVITAGGSYSYRLAKIADEYQGPLRQYIKNLKSGFSYDASAYYMITNETGVGLKYNSFKASEAMPGEYQVVAPNGSSGISRVSDDITVSFYGIGAIYNFIDKSSRHKIYLEVALGYMHYNNDAYVLGDYKITAGSFGSSVGITYQYMVTDGLSVGPKVSFAGGTLNRITYEGPNGFSETMSLGSENRENLLRIDLGAQVMFRF